MLSLKTEIGAEIRAADGTLVRKIPFRRGHSLLKQFVQLLFCKFSQTATTVKDVTGVEHSRAPEVATFAANATTQTTLGVLIGSGTTPVTMTDFKIETQLTTDITYESVTFAVENPDTATWRLAINRGFTNNTGAPVAVKEAALYVYQSVYPYIVCIDRTLYAVTFGAGETLTLTYRLTVTL